MNARRWRLLVAVAGVILVAGSFVPLWATYRIPGLGFVAPETVHQNAWAAYGLTMQLALALTVAVVVAVLVRPGGAAIALVLSAVVTLLLVWQIVRGPQGSADPGGYGIDRGLLLFAGGALAAAMTYGSHRALRETAPAGRVRG